MSKPVRHFYEFGPFRLDPQKLRLFRDGEPVPLPPKALESLLVLVRTAGRMLEREALMEAVWPDAFVEDANLTVAISVLRKALGQWGDADYIETIPRVGYRFVGEVREVSDEPAPLIIEKQTLSQTVIEEEFFDESAKVENLHTPTSIPAIGVRYFVGAGKRAATFVVIVVVALACVTGTTLYYRNRYERNKSPALVHNLKSIAVLPPRVIPADAEGEIFSFGIADALITKFGGLRKLAVRPSSAVSHYAGSQPNVILVGRELGVDAVLEGTLQRGSGRVRTTLQLVDVATGLQIWAGKFDESEADIFRLEDSISQQVAEALSYNLTNDERTSLTRHQTTNPEAYAAYLRGNYYWNKRAEKAILSVAHFRKAIDIDPNFAEAYVGLAKVYAATSTQAAEASVLVDKALQLDGSLAEAHATYAFIRMFHHWDWNGAGQAFDRAVQLNPNSSVAHHWRGVYLSLLGRIDEAKMEMHRALELDPSSLIIAADIGQLHYFAREYDEALDYCRRVLAVDNQFTIAHTYLSDVYMMKGLNDEWLAEWLYLRNQSAGRERVRTLQEALRRSGPEGVARLELGLLSHVEAKPGEGEELDRARLYIMIGDYDRAFERLNVALEQRSFLAPFISVDPIYDPLRPDPRFTALIRRMGLAT